MQSTKNHRKHCNTIYVAVSIVLWLLVIIAAFIYPKYNWLVIAVSIILLVWIIGTLIYVFMRWSWFISDMLNEYKKHHDLFSGGFALMLLFLVLIITNCLVSAAMPEKYDVLVNTLSSFLITTMSAMIGLMGIQYTIATQEQNRKKDLRRFSKPYFVLEAYVANRILDDEQHTFKRIQIGLHIHNISGNIGIPYAVKSLDASDCYIELNYCPLQHDGMLKECIEIWSDIPYSKPAQIELWYKDAFENNYKMHVVFDLHTNLKLSNTRILSDEYVCN